jgi:hypothetical protein
MTGHLELIDKQQTILLASGPDINRQCHRMNVSNFLFRAIRHGPIALLALLVSLPAFGAAPNPVMAPVPAGLETVEVLRTNWIPRVITNAIEIRMPTNIFITEYRTNHFMEWRTNVVDVYRTNRFVEWRTNVVDIYRTNHIVEWQTNVIDVYRTNWVTRNRTNTIAIEQTQTNLVIAYQTNLNIITLTNWKTELVFQTNLATKILTNSVTVEQTRTNLTTRYQTNVNTLTLTNWETVLVFKTNRIKQPVAKVVEVNLPATPADVVKASGGGESKVATVTASATLESTTSWTVEATRTEKPPVGNQVEVQLKLKSARDAVSTLTLQEWRVERMDGSVLLFGQGQEFKRDLPPGTYKVQVTARLAEGSPAELVRANLEVTREGVSCKNIQ